MVKSLKLIDTNPLVTAEFLKKVQPCCRHG